MGYGGDERGGQKENRGADGRSGAGIFETLLRMLWWPSRHHGEISVHGSSGSERKREVRDREVQVDVIKGCGAPVVTGQFLLVSHMLTRCTSKPVTGLQSSTVWRHLRFFLSFDSGYLSRTPGLHTR